MSIAPLRLADNSLAHPWRAAAEMQPAHGSRRGGSRPELEGYVPRSMLQLLSGAILLAPMRQPMGCPRAEPCARSWPHAGGPRPQPTLRRGTPAAGSAAAVLSRAMPPSVSKEVRSISLAKSSLQTRSGCIGVPATASRHLMTPVAQQLRHGCPNRLSAGSCCPLAPARPAPAECCGPSGPAKPQAGLRLPL